MTLNWTTLLAQHRVQTHVTSAQEMNDLRSVVARDLQDAAIENLSDDRRFATAYNAALQLGKMVIACAGYRVVGQRHHSTTFSVLPLVLDPNVADLASYFDLCRRKRNVLDYDLAYVATETEADDLLAKVREFQNIAEEWIVKNHPTLAVREQ